LKAVRALTGTTAKTAPREHLDSQAATDLLDQLENLDQMGLRVLKVMLARLDLQE